MLLRLIRNATLLIEIDGRRILVDPMLDDVGARPPVENTPNALRNPLVPLPVEAEEVVRGLDAIVVTHMHRDHFDDTAAKLLPRDVPCFCQPEDGARLAAVGLHTHPISGSYEWEGLSIVRTAGRHGVGQIADELGPVSGFLLGDLYIAGDTIWCREVEDAIDAYRPRVVVVNGSGARFIKGDPIVMTVADIEKVAERVPTVVVVHLEAINHCLETRADVRSAVSAALVPEDGEVLDL